MYMCIHHWYELLQTRLHSRRETSSSNSRSSMFCSSRANSSSFEVSTPPANQKNDPWRKNVVQPCVFTVRVAVCVAVCCSVRCSVFQFARQLRGVRSVYTSYKQKKYPQRRPLLENILPVVCLCCMCVTVCGSVLYVCCMCVAACCVCVAMCCSAVCCS